MQNICDNGFKTGLKLLGSRIVGYFQSWRQSRREARINLSLLRLSTSEKFALVVDPYEIVNAG